MAVTTYSLFDALKRRYPPWKVLSSVAKDNPAFAMATKKTDGGGLTYDWAVEYDIPGRSSTFATAQTNAGRTRNARFQLTFGDDFGVVRIEQKLLEGGKGAENALVDVMRSQTDGIMTQLKNSLGRQMFSDGSGSIGQINATVAGTTLTLVDENDIVNFHVGQEIVFAANATSALRDSGAALGISAVDELNGSMTVDANLNTIAGLTASDLIFTQGDYVSASDRLQMIGLGGWIPTATAFTASSVLFLFTRNVNRTALAGYVFNDTSYPGYSEEEAIQLLARYIGRGGGTVNTAFMSHQRLTTLVLAVGNKEEFVKNVSITDGKGRKVAELGYDGVRIRTPSGVVECFADRSCPNSTIFAGDIDKLCVVSIGEAPHWITDPSNSNKARTMDSAAAVEFRLAAWPQMAIRRPRSWGRFDFA